ncbi:MAG: dienelactone hydrolase family protein, partial [Gammaproteobacteria bacterium]
MQNKISKLCFVFVLLFAFSGFSLAKGNGECHGNQTPALSFVSFQSLDIQQQPPKPLTVKGKLKLPFGFDRRPKGSATSQKLPAVVILHGSAGVDSRGDFYARALNAAGIATLEIDMWEARGLRGGKDRPPLPLFTYPDAFAALAFLSTHDNIDPNRIGVLGFSWGGVIALASAERLYADRFGNGLKFAAHIAHYPVCYGYNNPNIPALNPPDQRGTQFLNLTGAPVLIQIGTEDDYDNGPKHCYDMIKKLPEDKR